MSIDRIAAWRVLVGGPRDGAMLRLSLGQALLDANDTVAAIAEFRAALGFDAQYSMAWKQLGKALQSSGDVTGACAAFGHGIAAAAARGDKQAEKEMTVFLRRLSGPAE